MADENPGQKRHQNAKVPPPLETEDVAIAGMLEESQRQYTHRPTPAHNAVSPDKAGFALRPDLLPACGLPFIERRGALMLQGRDVERWMD